MSQEQQTKITAERSPRFPSDSLESSIERIEKIFAGLGRSAAPAEALASALDYKSLNGTSRTTLAGLSYYGLLEREGNNHRVSDLAVRIIRPVSDADKAAALHQSAMEPSLFSQIKNDHPAVTENLLATLLLHKGFTEDGSKKAAKVYKDNLEFLAKFPQSSVHSKPVEPAPAATPAAPAVSAVKTQMVTHAITVNELPVPIGENLIARIPFPMSEEDFELFVGTLNLWKKKLTAPLKPKARPAIWKNNNSDVPVTVVGEMKAADGATYYKVEGSDAGIPSSQVQFL